MIGCITPNVAVDRTYDVRDYARGGVFRPRNAIAAAGGKGLNVARAARTLGGEPLCAGFLAGHAGNLIAELVAAEGMSAHWTMLPQGETRTCIIMADPDARLTTVVNEAGPQVTAADWQRLTEDILSQAENLTHVCICGSAPPASPPEMYAALLAQLISAGKSVWVDTSGPMLEAALTVKGVIAKINRHEAAAVLGQPVETLEDAAQAAASLHTRTAAPVVLSLGSRGALYTDGEQVWHAKPPAVKVQSAVGSGDTLLAGLVVAFERGDHPAEALQFGVAAGTANAMSFGGASFTRDEVESLLDQVICERL